jgi:EAL domain-containing protein (putative c-di-GMP-specific phosphodiesterase class I)
MEAWSALGIAVPISVNVGALQLQQHDFVDKRVAILARHPGVARSHLELEILESSALKDIALVAQVLQACHAMEVRIALDDFGTGYSSLSYLKRFPLAVLKIDQSFVRDILIDPHDAAIAKTIIALGQSLGLAVIAEGVEQEGQHAFLLQHGCTAYQGYLFYRPMPIAQLDAILKRAA